MSGGLGIKSAGGDSVVVADFPIGSATLRPSTAAELRSTWVGILERQAGAKYEIVGYSDCAGDAGRNIALRQARAKAVAALFPKTAARASSIGGAPFGEYALDSNSTPEQRALNRSVIIRLPPAAPPNSPAPAPRDPHVMVPRQEPATDGCGQTERDMLAVAWPAAKLMVEKALEYAYVGKGAVNSYLLERYFGPDWITNVMGIRAGYQRILDGWFDWDPKFECHAQTDADCPHTDPHKVKLAYVTKRGAWPFTPTPYGSVHICAKAFTHRGMQELAATVVHELSHRLDNTGDPAYCSDPPQCNLPTKKALDNADSYAQYARTIFNTSM